MEGIIKMIDTWSMAYSLLVCVVSHFNVIQALLQVGCIQVVVLKRFFNITPTTSRLKMST